jgi:chromosome segregation ATPase
MDNSADSAKLASITAFLREVFAGEETPLFEVTPESLELLDRIAQLYRTRTREIEVQNMLLAKSSQFYETETTRMKAQLANIGFSLDSLPEQTRQSLEDISRIGALLGLSTLSTEEILLGMDTVMSEYDALSANQHEITRLRDDVAKISSDCAKRLNAAQRIAQDIRVDVKARLEDAESKKDKVDYLRQKASEYRSQADSLKVKLAHLGLSSDLTHGSIAKLYSRMQALEDELVPHRERLRSYLSLPPDMALARVQIETERARLAMMEDKLARLLNSS